MIFNLRAFFYEYNSDWKRLTFKILDNDVEPFTNKFLINKYNNSNGNEICPININKGEFYVKLKSKYFLNSFNNKKKIIKVPIEDLLDQRVNIEVEIQHYNNFDRKGWYFILKEIYGL
jgi:hypothetical protein